MSYSLFYTITGILFVIFTSLIIHSIYDYYSINKYTEFLHPTNETIFNKISTSILPIIIWAYLEVPILGYNNHFIIGLILNILINCAINYIIHYGHNLISEKEEKIIPIITIILANIIGFLVNYLILFIGRFGKISNSLIGLILITVLYLLIKILKPNIFIFKSQKK